MQHDATAAAQLRRLVNGYQASQAIHVCAKLGIADLLADGPRSVEELAAATGSHPASLDRLLAALAAIEITHEGEDGRFALGPLGDGLRSDQPNSIAGWAAFIGEPSYWQAWGDLLHSVQTGDNAFRHIHGTDPWTYRARHPEQSAVFDRAMTSLSRQVIAGVLAAYDFRRFATVVDVGGGNGALLAAILVAQPAMRGILFDQPHVVAGAGGLLSEMGVDDRCEVVSGSFFESVPAGGDAYLLKSILHDWEDDDCIAILRVCREAMPPGATLLALERALGPANERPDSKLSDLNMLVGPGGRERTAAAYAALFAAAGLRFAGETPSASGFSVFSAEQA